MLLLLCFVIFRISSGSRHFIRERFSSSRQAEQTFILPEKNLDEERLRRDTTFEIDHRRIIILVPEIKDIKGTFLLLPGWNFPPDDWCNKTSLCSQARKQGYFVVLPDMGKSVYQEKIFPETRTDWRKMPTRAWLRDTVIPFLQKQFGILDTSSRNLLVGLSTGARGVALLSLDIPKLFRGAAALSGDYDQSLLPNDRLMTGYYGSYYRFKKRWQTVDNVLYRLKDFCIPIYLGHGSADKTCTPVQTRLLYDSLKKQQPQLEIRLHMPEAGHDYYYWNSEVGNILNFFNGIP